jgi:phage-related protein
MVTIPGRNGALAIDQGYFENIEVSYPCGCFAETQAEFASKVSAFRNAIASRYSYKGLTDEYNTDEYRLGLYKSGLDVSAVSYGRAGEFTITFDCKPQRFLTSGDTAVSLTGSSPTITNPTLFESKPLIKVTGTGILTINNYALTILGASGQTLYIDCDTQEAWEMVAGSKVSRNDYIQNAGEEFPVLASGQNSITIGTGLSNLEITPRWWRV